MTRRKVSLQFVVDRSSARPDRDRGQRCSAATSLAAASTGTVLLPSQMSQIAGHENPWLRSLLWMTNERLVCSERCAALIMISILQVGRFSLWTCVYPCLTCSRVRKECSVGKAQLCIVCTKKLGCVYQPPVGRKTLLDLPNNYCWKTMLLSLTSFRAGCEATMKSSALEKFGKQWRKVWRKGLESLRADLESWRAESFAVCMLRWSLRRRSLSWQTSFDWSEMKIRALPGVSSLPAVRTRPGFQIKWTQPDFSWLFMRTIPAAENRGEMVSSLRICRRQVACICEIHLVFRREVSPQRLLLLRSGASRWSHQLASDPNRCLLFWN